MSAFKVWIHGTINCLGSPCWLHPVKSRWNLKITQLIPGKSFESNLRSWGSSLLTFSGCIGVGMGGFPPGRNCVGWKYHRVGVRGWQEMLDVGCWMMTDDDGCWWCWWWWRWWWSPVYSKICFFVCCHTFQSYLHIFTHTNYLLSVRCVVITIGILVHHHHHHHHHHRRCHYHYHDGHKDHGDKDGNLMEPSWL